MVSYNHFGHWISVSEVLQVCKVLYYGFQFSIRFTIPTLSVSRKPFHEVLVAWHGILALPMKYHKIYGSNVMENLHHNPFSQMALMASGIPYMSCIIFHVSLRLVSCVRNWRSFIGCRNYKADLEVDSRPYYLSNSRREAAPGFLFREGRLHESGQLQTNILRANASKLIERWHLPTLRFIALVLTVVHHPSTEQDRIACQATDLHWLVAMAVYSLLQHRFRLIQHSLQRQRLRR